MDKVTLVNLPMRQKNVVIIVIDKLKGIDEVINMLWTGT